MKVLLAPIGSRGDVQPMLSLGLGLREAGHDVSVACPPDFQRWVEELGFPFAPVGRDIQAWLSGAIADGISPLKVLGILKRYFIEEVAQQVAGLVEVVDGGVDVVVQAGVCAAGGTAAERAGVRCVQVFYSPALVISDEHAPALFPLTGAPGWVNRILWALNDRQFYKMLGAPLNRERAALGLDPLPSVHAMFPEQALAAWDEPLAGYPGDLERQKSKHDFRMELTRPTGYLHYPHRGEALEPALVDFLDAGEPPIYFGFGSMPDTDPRKTVETLAQVTAALGQRAVLCQGWAAGELPELPDDFLVIPRAPHPPLFARCKLIVHHGGAGTTATAARVGAPQVIVPHGVDQYDWGWRLHARGLAPKPVPKLRLTGPRLQAALAACLGDEAMAREAAEVGEHLRELDPVGAAVQWLERVAGA
jgi:UDP:flavonoid glycosyltransferase YjiC (YdhE family)